MTRRAMVRRVFLCFGLVSAAWVRHDVSMMGTYFTIDRCERNPDGTWTAYHGGRGFVGANKERARGEVCKYHWTVHDPHAGSERLRCSTCGKFKARTEFRVFRGRTRGVAPDCLTCDVGYRERAPAYLLSLRHAVQRLKLLGYDRTAAEALWRSPMWVALRREHREAIRTAYRKRDEATRQTGIVHHVDHDVARRGDAVSGLHVPKNLVVLTWYDNLRKSNRFEPANDIVSAQNLRSALV